MTSCTSSRADAESPAVTPGGTSRRAPSRHALLVLLSYGLFFTAYFSPILFTSRLLAPGDGVIYYLPNFYSPKVFWDTSILLGFPMTADPQVMSWYPLSLVFGLVPNAWNAFVVSAYVLASCFTYGYVFTLTGSRTAGAVSGLVYGTSGFMMAHLGHTTIIHSAAWLPLIIWSLEELRREISATWFIICCLAIACCALAGHAQILTYTLCVAGFYVVILGWSAPSGRWRYHLVSLVSLLIGIGLTALQTLPAAELSRLTPRAQLTIEDFAVLSVPPTHLPLLFFPSLFGSTPGYGTPYFGAPNLTEFTGYVGILPLMLAAVGVIANRRGSLSLFWLGVALVALLLALGDLTPLVHLTHQVPVVNLFRAPARHFLELGFAVSILSGLGVAAVACRVVRRGTVSAAILLVAAVMLACFAPFIIFPNYLSAMASKEGVEELSLRPWINPAVGVPLLVLLFAGLVLKYWHGRQNSSAGKIALLLMVAADLASFGWFYEWRRHAPPVDVLTQPAFSQKYEDTLDSTHQRILPVRGGKGTPDELPPLLSRLWGFESASGYGPLIPSRYSRLLAMPPHGKVEGPWRSAADESLNLTAARYVTLPEDEASDAVITSQGVSWFAEDMGVMLGDPSCARARPAPVSIEVPSLSATKIGIVSATACSTGVPDGAEVLRVILTADDGGTQTLSLRAGRDTSEWLYDCGDVRPHMRHGRAPVFKSLPVLTKPEPCEEHEYVAHLPVDPARKIKRLELQWVGPSGALAVKRISLIDERTGRSSPLRTIEGSLMDAGRWRHVESVGRTRVYENLRAMPRAWLTPQVVTVSPDEALRAIHTSRLPDGRAYDPSRVALVEEPLTLAAHEPDATASAQVVRSSATLMEVRTTSAAPSFLVTSDSYYPGWHVTIDGTPSHLFLTNYVLRGAPVPAGSHLVRFEFRPTAFYYGAAISAASLLTLMASPLLTRRRRNSESRRRTP